MDANSSSRAQAEYWSKCQLFHVHSSDDYTHESWPPTTEYWPPDFPGPSPSLLGDVRRSLFTLPLQACVLRLSLPSILRERETLQPGREIPLGVTFVLSQICLLVITTAALCHGEAGNTGG